jgi:hypothetical protein
MFSRKLKSCTGVTVACGVLGLLMFLAVSITSRLSSQTLNTTIIAERTHLSYSAATSEPKMIETIREVLRPDGSRAISRVRSVQTLSSPTGWETTTGKTLYDATRDVTYDIFPALRMYGSLPVGKDKYRPLVKRSSCADVNREGAQLISASNSRFGYKVELYRIVADGPKLTYKTVSEVELFPELGCLDGDQKSELWNKATNQLESRQIVHLFSLAATRGDDAAEFIVPKDFTEGKPSDILKAHQKATGRDCPECMMQTFSRTDERHRKLWEQRAAQKKAP